MTIRLPRLTRVHGRSRRALFALPVLFIALSLGACTTLVEPGAAVQPDRPVVTLAQAERGYARVLQRHVNDRGEVAFAALQRDQSEAGLPALEHYVRAIAATPLDTAAPTPSGRLAHLINAYNALSMFNVIASGIPRTHEGLANKLQYFVLREFEIGGTRRSLRSFENDVIRKLDEPRVHFALNCSAVACPQLPREPFSGARLDAQLEREATRFFARPLNLRIDHAERTVWLSEILRFYTADFVPGHADSLIAYAQRYVPMVLRTDYAVRFTPYDWTIANSARPRP